MKSIVGYILAISILLNLVLVYRIIDVSVTLSHQGDSLGRYIKKYEILSEIFINYNEKVTQGDFIFKVYEKESRRFKKKEVEAGKTELSIEQAVFVFEEGKLIKIY